MRRLFVLFWIVLLLMPGRKPLGKDRKIDRARCSGLATITQGSGGIYFIEGAGVDLTTGLSVSNSSLTATIQQRWNGARNAADGGNVLWGKVEVLVHASTKCAGR